MDFLDDLDTNQTAGPSTYAFNLNTQAIDSAESDIESDEQEDDNKENEQANPLGFDFSMKGSLFDSRNNQPSDTTQVVPDLNILDKVKQRLFGGLQDTQPIPPTQSINDQPINNAQTQPINDQPINNAQTQPINDQPINNAQTQPINDQPINNAQIQPTEESLPAFAFQNSSLFAPTQKISSSSNDTQVVPPPPSDEAVLPQLSAESAEIAPKKLPQLSVDMAEIKPSATKSTIASTSTSSSPKKLSNLFVESDDDEDAPPVQSLTAEQRRAKIAQLAERKKQQRLSEEKSLQSDLQQTTLTDEENELDADEYDKSIDSSRIDRQPTRKELQEQEKFINISKRKRQIVPTHTKKVEFTRDQFLSAFQSDDDEAETNLEEQSQPQSEVLSMDHDDLKSSPVTSPLKSHTHKHQPNNNDADADESIFSVMQSKQATHPASSHTKSRSALKNPIQLYAENLKRQLLSSPTKEQAADNKLIDLDSSDSESDATTRHLHHHPTASSPLPMPTPASAAASTASHHMNHQLDDLNKIPELSKETKLMLKQKFSKKKLINQQNTTMLLPANMRTNLVPSKTKLSHHNFLKTLKSANINQLTEWQRANPHANIEEAVNAELEGDSLFQREVERVRNIRKREKLMEKEKLAQLAKLNADDDYNPDDAEQLDVDDEEVPDSDFDEDVPDSDYDEDDLGLDGDGSDDDENDEDDEDDQVSTRRNRKLVVTDDEEGPTEEPTSNKRIDDSYMFGAADSLTQPQETDSTLVVDHKPVKQAPTTVSISELSSKTQSVRAKETELFQNLAPRTELQARSQDVDVSERLQVEPTPVELPSFQDLSPTQSTQPDSMEATQADPTQVVPQDKSTETQRVDDVTIAEKDDDDVTIAEKDDDDDDKNLADAVARGRQQIRRNQLLDEDDEENEPAETPEQIQARIKMYENKIRRQELKARKRRKEMERKGLKKIIEGEAEESEDEWKGIGGADNDESDQANSEDERMIDNDLNLDLNDQEIRQKFMEQYKIKDQKDLEKLIDDVKNHRLAKRAGGRDSLDIEFSDEEDELLLAWKRQIAQEQKQRFMQNKKLRKAAKNEKAKAFLELAEDIDKPSINLDDHSGSDVSDISEDEQGQARTKSESPFIDSNNATDKDDDDEDEDSAVTAPKKKRPTLKIKESFVKKTLSFLMVDSQRDEDDYARQQHISRYQHGVASSDEEIEDISTLKKKSLSNLQSKSVIDIEDNSQTSGKRSFGDSQITEGDDMDDDDDEEMMRLFKKPSIMQSFRSVSEQSNGCVSNGSSFSGVTVSKQYKVASSSKASITYMSKNQPSNNKTSGPQHGVNSRQNNFRSLKAQKIQKGVKDAKSNSSVKGLFNNSGFDN